MRFPPAHAQLVKLNSGAVSDVDCVEAAGKYTVIVVPCPAALLAWIRPEWASMIDLQMLSPRPLPWADFSRARDLSPR